MLIDGDLNNAINKISSYNSYILQILIGGQPVTLFVYKNLTLNTPKPLPHIQNRQHRWFTSQLSVWVDRTSFWILKVSP